MQGQSLYAVVHQRRTITCYRFDSNDKLMFLIDRFLIKCLQSKLADDVMRIDKMPSNLATKYI